MTDSPDPVAAGRDLTYRIVVENLGPDSTSPIAGRVGGDVVLSDLLPPGAAYKSSSTTKGTCSGNDAIFSCDLRVLKVKDPVTITLTVVPSQQGLAINTAAVYARGGALGESTPAYPIDPNPSNNQVSETTTVQGPGGVSPPANQTGADLSLTMTDNPDPVEAGAPLTYTMNVVNNGPLEAGLVQVSVILPPGVAYDRSLGPGTCSVSISIAVDCDVGTIAPNTARMIAIVVVPSRPGPIVSGARALSRSLASPDPILGNNVAMTTTTVRGEPAAQPPGADLSVVVTDNPDPVAVNAELTYQITVKNNGPTASTGSTVYVVSPPNAVLITNKFPQDKKCSAATNLIPFSCDVDPLSVGESWTLTYAVVAKRPGMLVNTAVLGLGTQSDPNLANNQSIENTTVETGAAPPGAAELALTVEDTPDPVKATMELSYALVVHNAGSDAAQNVVVTDLLPAGVTYRSASAGCEFNPSLRIVTCRRDSLAAGVTATMSIVVIADRGGAISNTARVDSTTIDLELSNNQASTPTTIEPAADLALNKTATPNPVGVGADLTYGLAVANAGPDSAQTVIVTEQLPSGVTFKSASSGCNFDANARNVTCGLGNIDQGSSGRATITVVPSRQGDLTSTARTTASTYDPDLSDNEASVRVQAGCGAGACASPDPPPVDEADGTGAGGNPTGGNGDSAGADRRGGNQPAQSAARPAAAGGSPASGASGGSGAAGGGSAGATTGPPPPADAASASGPPPPVDGVQSLALNQGESLGLADEGPPVFEPLPRVEVSRQASLPVGLLAGVLLLLVAVPAFRMLRREYPGGLRLPSLLALRR